MRVLIAEDDAVHRHLLRVWLSRWGYEVEDVPDGTSALLRLLEEDPPRLAILDWMMPGTDGTDVVKRIRATQRPELYVYTILLTSRSRRQDLIEGMESGADDYLTKPVDQGELQVRLRAAQRILNLQAELVATREALRVQATHDALTGVLNRGAIMDALRRENQRATREGYPFTLALVDLDHFKSVNDTWGHDAGDAVLREVTGRMEQAMRAGDLVGRYGGEEFLLVAPRCPRRQALAMVERVRTLVGQPIALPDGTLHTQTFSAGVLTSDLEHPAPVDELIKVADDALYEAKRSGRDCSVLAAVLGSHISSG